MKGTMELAIVAVCMVVLAGCQGGLFGSGPALTATRGEAPLAKVWMAPPINGKITDAWKKAPPLVLGNVMSDEVGTLKTTAYVLTDGKKLYVAWECMEPDTKSLIADATERDGQVWNDDSVELFISPDIDKGYYQFAINSKGVVMDGKHTLGDQSDNSWDSNIEVKTSVVPNEKWVVTMAVPLKDLGAPEGKNQTWLMNLNRTKPAGNQAWVESSWSAKGRSAYHDSEGWGKLTAVNVD